MHGSKDHLIEEWKQNLRHLGHGLVAKTTEYENARIALAVKQAIQAGTQSPCAGRVVGYVENPGNATSVDALQTCGPAGFVDAFGDCGRRDGKAVVSGE